MESIEGINRCKQHNSLINFFCTANQWHFKPLCSECIPSHTQKHQKNVKIILQGSKIVLQRTKQQKKKAQLIYQQKLTRIEQLLNIDPIQFAQYKLVKQMENQLIKMIKFQFQNLKKTIEKARQQIDEYQKQLLTKLRNNIVIKLSQISSISLDQPQFDEKWVDIVRGIYFKGDLEIYKNQIEQVINQYETNIVNFCPKFLLKEKDILAKRSKDIFQSLKVEIIAKRNQKQQETSKGKQQLVVKTVAVKPIAKNQKYIAPKPKVLKRKKCQYCDQQMEYLTQLKKHLVCKYCGGKERNYIKK